jgi:hypothetical protein
LKERLRLRLPAFLSLAGLNPTRGDEFLAFIDRYIPIGKEEHLRDVLPRWLKAFGGAAAHLDALSDAHLKWVAVRVVAGRVVAGEPPAARQAREELLKQPEVVSRADVDRLTATGVLPAVPKGFWPKFFTETGREEGELHALLQAPPGN